MSVLSEPGRILGIMRLDNRAHDVMQLQMDLKNNSETCKATGLVKNLNW